MLPKGVTLRGLEVFEALASAGTVGQTARLTGLSQPAVSQQLRNLETALGTDLVDHNRRPMRLTSAGEAFLARAEAALSQLRLAQSELTVMDLAHLISLSIGIIDDFDDNLTPRLATILGDSLTGCRFKMITASSQDIRDALHENRLHIGIAAKTEETPIGVVEYPIARDPFIIAAPPGVVVDLAAPPKDLPFLRYETEQLISRQIDGFLTSRQTPLPDRFEIGSHLALMAMVARGIGWAITTPLGYMRAARFHDKMEAHPIADTSFARHISLFANEEWDGNVPKDIAQTMRALVQAHMIDPALIKLPWLAGALRILED